MRKDKIIQIGYILLFFIMCVLFAIGCFTFSKGFIMDFIFDGGKDAFMDFVNSIRDASTIHVYDVKNVIYPALPNCFFYLLSLFHPQEMRELSFVDRYLMQFTMMSITQMTVFLIFCFLLLFWILMHQEEKNKKFMIVIFLSFVFSMPMLWAAERGNIIILSVIFCIGFSAFYKSNIKKYRELSYIFLALAATIKIYPVIFVLLLLFEKDYKGFFKSVIYFLIFFLVPFVFYDGVNGFYYMLKSILSFSDRHVNSSVIDYCTSIPFFLKDKFQMSHLTLGILLTDIIYILIAYMSPKMWIKGLMLVLVVLNFSGSQIEYNSLYFLMVMMLWLQEKDKNVLDIVGGICLCLIIFPNPFYISSIHLSNTTFWKNSIMYFVFIFLGIGLLQVISQCVTLKPNRSQYKYR